MVSFNTLAPLRYPGEDFFDFICGGVFCLISLVSSFAKEETRETRRKEKKEERLPQSRWAFWRNGSFASSAQTVSRLLGETAGVIPSANPTVPDLLVYLDGGQ